MGKNPPPPDWLINYCELHGFGEPYYKCEDPKIDEWIFMIDPFHERMCCYMVTWTVEEFLASMETVKI